MSSTSSKMRADGWIPSVYGCSKRRKNPEACDNRFVGDGIIGPFVFTLLSNILKARNNSGERSVLALYEKKLLKGEALRDVKAIDQDGLQKLFSLSVKNSKATLYEAQNSANERKETSERELLEMKRTRCETGLARLQSLYLYGDEGISEKDYILQRAKLQLELEKTNKRLETIKKTSEDEQMEDLNAKASYLIMVGSLVGTQIVDYEKYIRSMDPSVPRAFLRTVIKNIIVTDGKVTGITFTNNVELKFKY